MAKKKFDLVTILGLGLALAMLIFGQMYVSRRQAAYNQYQQQPSDKVETAKTANIEPGGATVKLEPKTQKTEQSQVEPREEKDPKPVETAVPEETELKDAGDVTVSTNKFEQIFTARGASLKRATLSDQYTNAAEKKQKGVEILSEIEPGKRAFGMPSFEVGPPEFDRQKERLVFDQAVGALQSLDRRIWKLDENSNSFDANGNWKLVYSATLKKFYKIIKTFTLQRDSSVVLCDMEISNTSGEPVNYSYAFNGPAGILLDGPPENPKCDAYVSIVAELGGREALAPGRNGIPNLEIKQVDPGMAAKELDENTAISYPENLWGAVKNRFFMAMLISRNPSQLIKLKAIPVKSDQYALDKRYAEPNLGIQAIRRKSETLAAGQTGAMDQYALYLGPADETQLNTVQAALNLPHLSLGESIKFYDLGGWQWPRVEWLSRQMLWLFTLLNKLFGNYGLSVILLTLVVKLALHPLQRKMTISMTKMSKIQPEIKKIQEKYKGQNAQAQQKMYMEMRDLQKKHGVSYSAGCLPIFLQIPIFTAIYGIFNRAFEMRGAEFLWINDLSQQDCLMRFGFWPYMLNLLPLLYMAVTIIQSIWITPTPKSNDPQQEMSRKMGLFMPIMFSVLFYSMPSGLVLYFAASAIFGMLETWYIRKHLIKN
ncbi:MAG: YidC/Oxa1 family insertase periplasmic-domain containing protein [Planctomycetota bacterium]